MLTVGMSSRWVAPRVAQEAWHRDEFAAGMESLPRADVAAHLAKNGSDCETDCVKSSIEC